MRDDDLFHEIEEQEAADDARFKQQYRMQPLRNMARKPVDSTKARKQYEEEIKPVLEARARVLRGEGPTNNPLKNLYLKLTGQDQIVERPDFKMVEPSKGLVLDGPTLEEVRKEIEANPEAFRDLAKSAPEVRSVEAKRKGPEDIRRND